MFKSNFLNFLILFIGFYFALNGLVGLVRICRAPTFDFLILFTYTVLASLGGLLITAFFKA